MFDEKKLAKRRPSVALDELTDEQILFYANKQRISRIQAAARGRELTIEEADEINSLMNQMYSVLIKYIYNVMNKNQGRFYNLQDARADIVNTFYFIFRNKLDAYDPLQTAPITYFGRDITGVVSRYIRNASLIPLPKNQLDQLRIVKRAIDYYESIGVKWDIPLLAQATKMSTKLVSRAVVNLNTSQTVSDLEQTVVPSTHYAPETVFFDNDHIDHLRKCLDELLTKEELDILMTRTYARDHILNYTELSAITHIEVRTLKQIFSGIQRKLERSEELRELYPHKFAKHGADILYQDDISENASVEADLISCKPRRNRKKKA